VQRGFQAGQQREYEAVVVRLAGGQREPYWQSVGINDCMNLARHSASRPAHQLFCVACNAGSVLMNPDNGRVDHLHCRVMFDGQCVHDSVPDASSAPSGEAIIASCVRPKVLRPPQPTSTLPAWSLSPPCIEVRFLDEGKLAGRSVADGLRNAGYTVLETASGEEAITFCKSQMAIDMLFTDINLAGPTNGWDVAECFRTNRPNMPVLYASGKSFDTQRRVPGGVFVPKPYKNADILEACKRPKRVRLAWPEAASRPFWIVG
jgi:CheY-like chemotaxis protein